jgi:hypothetical protein
MAEADKTVFRDWLRRETAHALATGRNVVPVLANEARMPHPNDLPAEIERVASFNAVPIHANDVAHGIARLRAQLMRSPRGIARTGRLDIADALRLLDHVVDGGSIDVGDLFDPIVGPELVNRIGPLTEATLAAYVRPWCSAWLSRTAGTPRDRIVPSVLRWLFPPPPASSSAPALSHGDPLPATLVEAAVRAAAMMPPPVDPMRLGRTHQPRPDRRVPEGR